MSADTMILRDTLPMLDDYLLQALTTDDAQLQQQLRLTLASGGKRLRPALVLLCARLCDERISEEAVLPIAAAMEMIHTASLIHDDVLDEAELRRGCASLHMRVGRQKSVLYGDYLLARAIVLLEQYQNPQLYGLLGQAVSGMCLGELQQLESAFLLGQQTIAQYFKCIRRKTAGLMMACCQAGAQAAQAGAAATQTLGCFGENIGLAFQLADDMLDFLPAEDTGKPQGQDLRQGLFTYPLLFALRHSPQADKLAAYAQKRDKTGAELDLLLTEVEKTGGLAATQRLVLGFSQKAANSLDTFPHSAEKSALLAMCGMICR